MPVVQPEDGQATAGDSLRDENPEGHGSSAEGAAEGNRVSDEEVQRMWRRCDQLVRLVQMRRDQEELKESMLRLDMMVHSMKSQIMMTEQRLSRMIAALSIVEKGTNEGYRGAAGDASADSSRGESGAVGVADGCNCGTSGIASCARGACKGSDLAPMTHSQAFLMRLGFARFRWFRRRVGGRWCYRRCWINDYPHSSSTVCVHRWERHPTATMGEDILEVEQYEMMKLPEARLVDRS
jgi:hypothetical protein